MNYAPRYFLALLAGTSFFIGCSTSGPELSSVTGTVTLDGQPLEKARIVFQPTAAGGSPASGHTDAEGRFSLTYGRNKPGAMLGENIVRIRTFRPVSSGEAAQGISYPERVPPRYNDESELIRHVKAGNNVFKFSLEGELPVED